MVEGAEGRMERRISDRSFGGCLVSFGSILVSLEVEGMGGRAGAGVEQRCFGGRADFVRSFDARLCRVQVLASSYSSDGHLVGLDAHPSC